MKKCTKCGIEKELTSGFYRNKRSRDGYLTVCRRCVCAERREYVAANKEKVYAKTKAYIAANKDRIQELNRAYHKKHRERLSALKRQIETGFSPALFDTTLAFQEGKCGICAKALTEVPRHQVHADHCHETGAPRGVLCHSCNTSLGRLGDNIEGIRKVLSYLENPPAAQMKLIA